MRDQRLAPKGASDITIIDAPGAQGTLAIDINGPGAIVGYYLDFNSLIHGFLRVPDGTITSIDAPGAIQTISWSINPHGTIAGSFMDGNNVNHGFVRTPTGAYTTIDVPNAGTGAFQGTQAVNINPAGVIAGEYTDGSGVFHGFVRTASGTVTPFDAPGAGTMPGQGTQPDAACGLNPAGAVAGGFIDGNGAMHGFLRAASGSIAEYDVKSAQATGSSCVNPAGAVTGTYTDANGVTHGYVRDAGGSITTVDVPGAGNGPPSFIAQGTSGLGINPGGVVVGDYVDATYTAHGFVRAQNGTFTTFDVPGISTFPLTNTSSGDLVGYFVDSNQVTRGFLRRH